jgi:hypothetical protein
MATDMMKLLAPGLADIQHLASPPPEEPRSALTPGGDPPSLMCGTCGRQCKSTGGLASHRRTHAP